MRAAFFISAFAATAFAQSSGSEEPESATSVPVSEPTADPAPQTSYLTLTNSQGVVTGGPAVDTMIPSQPAADSSIPAMPPLVTSQPLPYSIPAVHSGINTVVVPIGANQTTHVVVSANNSTTIVVGAPQTLSGSDATMTGSRRPTGTGAEDGDASATSSGAGATGTGGEDSPGAAANVRAMAGGVVGAGFLALFL